MFKTLAGRQIAYTFTEKGCNEPQLKSTSKLGYVQIQIGGRNGRKAYLHRLAYEAYYGISIKGRTVMHNCDNPRCFNAKHLSLGTQADNMQDKALKGRAKGVNKGESNGRATINESTARAIYTTAGTYNAIAEQFNVSYKVVANIKTGNTWRWATEGLVKPITKQGRPAK